MSHIKKYFFFLNIVYLINTGKVFPQQKAIDSIGILINQPGIKDTIVAKSYIELTELFYDENPDTSAYFCEKTISFVDQKIINAGKREKIVLLYCKSDAYNNLGVFYFEIGQIKKGLEAYHKAIKIQEQNGDTNGASNSLLNLGVIYYNQGQLNEALTLYLKCLKIKESLKDTSGIAKTILNIGSVYQYQGKPEEALRSYERSLQLHELLKDKKKIAVSLSNIRSIYVNIGQFEKAKEYAFKTLSIRKEIKDKKGAVISYGSIGDIFLKEKRFAEAKCYVDSSLRLANEIGQPQLLRDVEVLKSKIEANLNNFKEALEHYKLYISYRDSLINEENTKKIVQTQMQYDFDKKENETKAEQDKKDVIADEEKQKQKIIIASVSAGLFLVLILAIVIFRSLRQNQKKNKIITEQKLIVEKQKELVEEKQKEILDSIRYAKRIQTALITSEKYIAKNLNRLIKNV